MPYFDTDNLNLALNFLDHINIKMDKLKGYKCAKFSSRIEQQYIDKFGKYRIGINMWQSSFLNITPSKGSMFSEEDVKKYVLHNN